MKTKTNKSKSTFKKILALGLSIGLLASIGIGAYLTDTDVKEDVYTVGNVQAEIVSVGDMEMDNVGALLPNTIHQYERAAMNTGINDAYVFMSVTIPFDYAGPADIYGNQLDVDKLCQLFKPVANDAVGIGSEWKIVDDGFLGQYAIDFAENMYLGTHDDYYVIAGNTITYVYGYVGDNADGTLKALASGETTSNLMDAMGVNNFHRVANITGEISTKLYAIQTNHVNGGLTDVNGVWAVINTALVGEIEAPADPVAPICPVCDEPLELMYVDARPAECDLAGLTTGVYACSYCGEAFWYDEDCQNEANFEDFLIPQLGHIIVDGRCTREGCVYSEQMNPGDGEDNNFDPMKLVFTNISTVNNFSSVSPENEGSVAHLDPSNPRGAEVLITGLLMQGETATINLEITNDNECDAGSAISVAIPEYYTNYIRADYNNHIIVPAGETVSVTITLTVISMPTEYIDCGILIWSSAYSAN